MFKFVLISVSEEKISCPFILRVEKDLSNVSDDFCYLVRSMELASTLFNDFDFSNNYIRDNFYWYADDVSLEALISELMSVDDIEPIPIFDTKDLIFDDDTYYYVKDERMYLLNDKFYQVDLSILSKLNQMKIDVDYVVEDNFIGGNIMKVRLKEYGLLDDLYSIDNFVNYMSKRRISVHLLYLYKYINENVGHQEYNIEGKYDNPYKNLLLIEDYLNNQRFYNIDVDKCNDYNLKFDSLPVRYKFNGFYSTTGRIFCSSDTWTPIQNIAKDKRDILFADSGCYFIEFDYKSFEFDILCQLIGIGIMEDPHTNTYNKLIGKNHNNARDIGKTINYAFIYGMNERRLAEMVIKMLNDTSISVDDFIDRLNDFEITSQIKEFDSVLKSKISNNTIVNYYGRRIHFRKDYAYLNNYIQSTAADFINNKFLRLVDMLHDKNKLLLQNFDSMLIQMTCHDVENTDLFERVMNMLREPIAGISGRVDYKYGLDWKNLS